MKYPTVSLSTCEDFASKKIRGLDPTIEEKWTGRGDAVNLSPVDNLAEEVRERVMNADPDVDKDKFEGKVAGKLYKSLSSVPVEVLDDPGFWRYISIKYFWNFISWRERKPFEKGNYLKYLSGHTNTEAVLPRMYLRAKSVGSHHTRLAGVLDQSADFWRSHVLRVRTGSAPALTRSFVRMQADDRLMTDSLRDFAKGLNRVWSNIQLHLYDEDQSEELIREIRNKYI